MIGKTISHYKILEKLGEGGMGVVYKAEDTKLKRTVALKFLPPHLTADSEAKKRFLHEAQAASSLDHPNICTIHEINVTEECQIYIAMALYDGQTLKDKLESGPLELEEVIEISLQVAQGLYKAHRKSIIHRDIKPDNIFLTKDGLIKILDFGLAKLTGQTKLTKEGTTLGTIAYMSPEQTRGEPVDYRSDIWSLGVMMYEMITGQLPFRGDYDLAVIYSIINEEPERMNNLRKEIPDVLEGIVDRALAKGVEDRYRDMGELVLDLKRYRKGVEVPELFRRFEAVWKKMAKAGGKKLSILIGAVLFMVIGFVIFRFFILGEVIGSTLLSIAVLPFENQTGDESLNDLGATIQDYLITKLANSKYLSVTTRERMSDLLKQMGRKDEDIDTDLGFELCSLDNVTNVVVGNIQKYGDNLVLSVKVIDADTKELREGVDSQGEGRASIPNQVDELASEISKIVGLSRHKIEENIIPVGEMRTPSSSAYRYFVKGKKELNLFNFKEAKRFLEMAVDIDSSFALAYLFLGRAIWGLRDSENSQKAYEKAKYFSSGASPKDSMYIASQYFGIERDDYKGFQILKEMLRRWPGDIDLYLELAFHYWKLNLNDKAIETYQKILRLKPDNGEACNNLGYMYMNLQEYEKALGYFEKYADLNPGEPDPLTSIGELYLRMGRLDEAIDKYVEATLVKPDFFLAYFSIGYIHALKEQYTEATKAFASYMEKAPSLFHQAFAHGWNGMYYNILGQVRRAIGELDSMIVICESMGERDFLIRSLRIKAWVYTNHERFDLARNTMNQLKQLYSKQNQKPTSVYYHLLGLLDIRENRVDSAKVRLDRLNSLLQEEDHPMMKGVKFDYDLLMSEVLIRENHIEEAIEKHNKILSEDLLSFYPYPMTNYNYKFPKDFLARAYFRKGNLDKTIEEYERLIHFDAKRNDWSLINPKLHFILAELYEEKGMKDRAIEQYEKFLDIWKDADEDLPKLVDAKSRLARLTGQE